ncbi:hypothetical protein VOLCADRAFT_77846 [Volvox carteri f. nagariensis]|uniref:SCP domain-containing protein n=1 Tax=Volvox carteri f. nagariensis TaxID=3068 RepID=D8UHQ2_VOLCA|nr:uncharacterized protein VOLCADRAFT_77846 [Volvox carteri f. nagariensis]EFJ40746.1 hypothetical protein VOLCADRAFT_77846 [Volvox carteri f. nagariensis]|eukprot:XP_002958212.1 hypothetical protein VOLCADRAFT_77846 [Volvox carteri f. nagariensis]
MARHFQGAVDRHNYYRALHGAPRLMWSPELAYDAAAYAVVAAKNYHAGRGLQHARNLQLLDQGENLAAGHASAEEAVDSFYSEVELYNYYKPGFSTITGHFTQVVWQGSTQIGIAEVDRVYVFRYRPAGNVCGTFQDNVLPPDFRAPSPMAVRRRQAY